jgi:hypothetical protein
VCPRTAGLAAYFIVNRAVFGPVFRALSGGFETGLESAPVALKRLMPAISGKFV